MNDEAPADDEVSLKDAVSLDVQWPAEMSVTDAAGTPCVDVPPAAWLECVGAARDQGYTYFDWLSAVDQLDAEPAGVEIVVHLAALPGSSDASDGDASDGGGSEAEAGAPADRPRASAGSGSSGGGLRRLLIRSRVLVEPQGTFEIASLTGVFRGAAWHERETYEMFGVVFAGFDDGSGAGLRPLLLPDGFEGTPLRKSFVLAARAAKPWPGAKEPGEGGEGSPSRRKALPPGVPDPVTWGPRDR